MKKKLIVITLASVLFYSCTNPNKIEVLDSKNEDFVRYRIGDTIYVHVLTLDHYHSINMRTHEQTLVSSPIIKDLSNGPLILELEKEDDPPNLKKEEDSN